MKQIQLFNKRDTTLSVTINVDKLELIRKALGVKLRAQVGILGASPHNRSIFKARMATERNPKTNIGRPSKSLGSELTNAEIGAIHEFGRNSKPRIPQRSFLWMPLKLYLQDYVNKKASVFNRYITLADHHKMYELLGITAENVVQAAFQSGGFGNWEDISEYTKQRKGSDKILIDTSQLRKSITSRVV